MKAILVSDAAERLKQVYSEETLQFLRAHAGLDTACLTGQDIRNHPERFSSVRYLFSTWGCPAFTEEEIGALLPNLECVFYAAGSVQYFARPYLHRGVKVFSAWAANAVPVAEYTAAQILLANKGFFASSRHLSAGHQSAARHAFAQYPGNYDVNVGIIGAGMVGKRVIQALQQHNVHIFVFDPFLPDEQAQKLGATKCDLTFLFKNCQTVSNHLANNASTRGMLNGALFEQMLPYATFINTGRGAQVVEDDLIRVLTNRPDLTALLDVTDPEPPEEGSPLYALPNCILTPHIAGSSGNEVHRMAEYMKDEFLRYASGQKCLYEVTEAMLETMA